MVKKKHSSEVEPTEICYRLDCRKGFRKNFRLLNLWIKNNFSK